jgi:hypothetical protein
MLEPWAVAVGFTHDWGFDTRERVFGFAIAVGSSQVLCRELMPRKRLKIWNQAEQISRVRQVVAVGYAHLPTRLVAIASLQGHLKRLE